MLKETNIESLMQKIFPEEKYPGKFDLKNVVINIVAGLGLLSFISMFCDFILLNYVNERFLVRTLYIQKSFVWIVEVSLPSSSSLRWNRRSLRKWSTEDFVSRMSLVEWIHPQPIYKITASTNTLKSCQYYICRPAGKTNWNKNVKTVCNSRKVQHHIGHCFKVLKWSDKPAFCLSDWKAGFPIPHLDQVICYFKTLSVL